MRVFFLLFLYSILTLIYATSVINCSSIPADLRCINDTFSKECGFDKFCSRNSKSTKSQKVSIIYVIGISYGIVCAHWTFVIISSIAEFIEEKCRQTF